MAAAIARARTYVLAEAAAGFPDARHAMTFPRWAGFDSGPEEQASDVFARAVLGGLCANLVELERAAGADPGPWRALAEREAGHVAGARLADRRGGWSYFPGLEELPPDLDSLAAAITLFSTSARQHLASCEEPVGLALEGMRPDGGIATWILSPRDPPAARRAMRRGIRRFWGEDVAVDVCARFGRALLAWDAFRFAAEARRCGEFVAGRQAPTGAWHATWYWGPVAGTALGLAFLRALGGHDRACRRAVDFLRRSQRGEGGWGVFESVPLDTAVALCALSGAGAAPDREALGRAVHFLLDRQALDGHWGASPWIKMETGRAGGRVSFTLTYQSATLTTAVCLCALLWAAVLPYGSPSATRRA